MTMINLTLAYAEVQKKAFIKPLKPFPRHPIHEYAMLLTLPLNAQKMGTVGI